MELLIYLGKAATILSIFYLVYISVLRKDTLFSVNRHFLFSGILAAISFPFISITKTILIETPLPNEAVYGEFLQMEQIPMQEAIPINWLQIAFIIYLVGVCIMSLRFMKQLLSLGLLLYKYPSEKKNGYRYIVTSENTPPFSFFKNIVYNPELHAQQELEMILKHEEVHASQWHSVDIIATNLLLVFQWINPMAWFYKKGVEENLEYIADSATVQQIESVKQYQLALVKASSTSPIPALTNNFYQSFIKKRIVMLNKSTSKKINAWKLTLVLPFLAVFLWSFNINEVVTYSDSSTSDSEFTSSSSTSERINLTSEEVSNNAIRNVIPKDNSNPLIEETPIVVANSSNRTTRKSLAITSEKNLSNISEIALKEAMITITKNTTKMELKAMKSKLKSKGVSFDYSNLVYNDSNEIIAISINYKSNKGNSGSYSVNSDTPINTIVIKKDGDRVSVQSNGSHNHSYSSDESIEMSRARREEQQERLERHQEEMENRKGDMKERQEEMELRQEEMLERQVEAEGRRAEAQHRMEERRAEIQERQLEIYKAQKEISEHHDVFISEGGSSDNHGVHIIRDSDGGLFEIQDTHHGANDVIIVDRIIENGAGYSERQHSTSYSRSLKRITKNSTKSDLENLKTSYDSKGISFSYSGVKRNNAGEITKIRLKIKDNKGSSSSSSYNGDGKAIEDIFIDTDNGITIMKGGSH